MARRGGKSAGFWMIQRRKENAVNPNNPNNPFNLPEYTLTGTGLFFGLTLTDSFVLIIL